MKTITALPATPPVVANDNVFYDHIAWTPNCTLYVPAGSEDAYKAAVGWRLFAQNTYTDVPSATVSGIKVSVENGAIIITGTAQPQVSVFDMQGRFIASANNNRVEIPQSGVYIVKVGKETFKIKN